MRFVICNIQNINDFRTEDGNNTTDLQKKILKIMQQTSKTMDGLCFMMSIIG
jgi:hypothetical protein